MVPSIIWIIFLDFLDIELYLSLFVVGSVDAALKTTLHLREYEDVIEPTDIYSLLGKTI